MTTSTEVPTVPEQRRVQNTGTGADYAALAPMLFWTRFQNVYRGPAVDASMKILALNFGRTLRWKLRINV